MNDNENSKMGQQRLNSFAILITESKFTAEMGYNDILGKTILET